MGEARSAHTAGLDAATLGAVRALLDAVFEGEMTDHDWDHALGGVHALEWEGEELVGHASVIGRRVLHGGRALRAGYLEGVGVRADRRRRGHGAAIMEALERVGAAGRARRPGATSEAAGLLCLAGLEAVAGADLRAHSDRHHAHRRRRRIHLKLTCDWRDGNVW